MRRIVSLCLIALLFTAIAPCAIAQRSAARPVVLVFETNKGEGADRELAAATTKALRTYLRETERVDAAAFDRESPTVKRAIMEKHLTEEQVASYSSREERLQVAQVLGFNYAAGSEISVKEGTIEVRLWVGQVGGETPQTWESIGSARATGAGSLNLDNAMQSAASAAVVDMDRKAFAELPRIPQADPTGTADTAAITATPAQPAGPSAQDYVNAAEKNLEEGSIAQAIQNYSRAVNADPANASLRLKLAEAYAQKGMFDEALAEIGRATIVGGSEQDVAATRDRIEKMRAGQAITPVNPAVPEQPENPDQTSAQQDSAPVENPDTQNLQPKDRLSAALAKMLQGDKLWNSGQPDEAAQAYKESIALNSADWRAHERLAVVTASIALFDESRRAIAQLNAVQPNPPVTVVTNRYEMLRKAFDKHFASLLRQYDADYADYTKQSMTRERYYISIKGMAERLETMTQFLDSIPVPDSKQSINLRRSLACGLMAQAASSMLDYLETNNDKAKTDAETFVMQAKKEVETAARLETASTTAGGSQ